MRNVKPIGRGKMEKTKGKRRLSKSEREKRKDKVTSFIVLAIAAVFFIFPFLYMFGSSVKSDLDLQLHPEMIFPSDWSEWTFERYLGFFVYEGQVAALPVLLLNSLWSTGATVLLTIVLDLLMAYAVIFIRFKAKKPIVNFLYIWMAIPGVIATAPQFALYATFRNMFNLYEGMGAYFYIYLWLILPGTTSIFNVLLMRNMFASIPMEIIESARSDGAKNRTIFFRIVVPFHHSFDSAFHLLFELEQSCMAHAHLKRRGQILEDVDACFDRIYRRNKLGTGWLFDGNKRIRADPYAYYFPVYAKQDDRRSCHHGC